MGDGKGLGVPENIQRPHVPPRSDNSTTFSPPHRNGMPLCPSEGLVSVWSPKNPAGGKTTCHEASLQSGCVLTCRFPHWDYPSLRATSGIDMSGRFKRHQNPLPEGPIRLWIRSSSSYPYVQVCRPAPMTGT
jgi:hypothetical protein